MPHANGVCSPHRFQPSRRNASEKVAPVRWRNGDQVEYYSRRNGDWIPAVITQVDDETGQTQIDVKPGVWFSLQKRQKYIRDRVVPGLSRLHFVRDVIREGRIDEVADDLYSSSNGPTWTLAVFKEIGQKLDAMLGTSGHGCMLLVAAQSCALKSHGFDKCLQIDVTRAFFRGVFWDMLMTVHKTYGCALNREVFLVRKEVFDPNCLYDFVRKLGKGAYGVVWRAVHKETGVKRAIKQIAKKSSRDNSCAELEYLLDVDHPNIVKVYDFLEDQHSFYIVMDLCNGGDLRACIYDTERRREEPFVAHVLEQVLLAVSHMHCHGLVHKDLKPQNVVLTSAVTQTMAPGAAAAGNFGVTEQMPHVMVIDLGIAEVLYPGFIGNSKAKGTRTTMAPEVWQGIVTPRCDVFSCGAILYEMLARDFAWKLSKQADGRAFWRARPQLDKGPLRDRSPEVIDLVESMSQLDRMARPTVCECLVSPFLQRHSVKKGVSPMKKQEIMARIAKASKRSVLHRSVALALASKWPSNQLPSLKKMFFELDKQRQGRLHPNDMYEALVSHGYSGEEALECASSMDMDNDGFIGWTEFVAMCLKLSSDQLEADLQRIFKQADMNRDGYLSPSEIKSLFASERLRTEDFAREELERLFGKSGGEAHVDWRQFKRGFDSRVIEEVYLLQENDVESASEEEIKTPRLAPTCWHVQDVQEEFPHRDRGGIHGHGGFLRRDGHKDYHCEDHGGIGVVPHCSGERKEGYLHQACQEEYPRKDDCPSLSFNLSSSLMPNGGADFNDHIQNRNPRQVDQEGYPRKDGGASISFNISSSLMPKVGADLKDHIQSSNPRQVGHEDRPHNDRRGISVPPHDPKRGPQENPHDEGEEEHPREDRRGVSTPPQGPKGGPQGDQGEHPREDRRGINVSPQGPKGRIQVDLHNIEQEEYQRKDRRRISVSPQGPTGDPKVPGQAGQEENLRVSRRCIRVASKGPRKRSTGYPR